MSKYSAFGKAAGRKQKQVRKAAPAVRSVGRAAAPVQRRVQTQVRRAAPAAARPIRQVQRAKAPAARAGRATARPIVAKKVRAVRAGAKAAAPAARAENTRRYIANTQRRDALVGAKGRARLASFRFLPRYDVVGGAEDTGAKIGNGHFPYASQDAIDRAHFPSATDEAKKLWPQVRRHLGLPKGTPMPKMHQSTPGERQATKAAAWVYPDLQSDVYVTPQVVRQVTSSAKGSRAVGKGVLIHEWAHTRQRGAGTRSTAAIEGGAEEFKRLVAKKLGLPSRSASDDYRRYAKKARRKGRKYALDTQFKGDH